MLNVADLAVLFAGVKLKAGKEIIIHRPYDEIVSAGNGEYLGKLRICDDVGEFVFRDAISVRGAAVTVRVECTVARLSDDVSGIGVFCGAAASGGYEDLGFFLPSAWYGKGEVFEGKSNKYPMRDGIAGGGIDGIGAPVCAAYRYADGLSRSLEMIDPSYRAAISVGDEVISECNSVAGLGVKREDKTLLFCSYPASSYHIAGTDRTVGYYLPAAVGAKMSFAYRTEEFYSESFHSLMKTVWRRAYATYASVNDAVDTEIAREALLLFVGNSCAEVSGVKQYMTRADHFTHESGFLYRNADLAYVMLAHGFADGDEGAISDAVDVIDRQVDCLFAGEKQVFPFERSRAEGVKAIYDAYVLLKAKGREKPTWLSFVRREAERFERTDEYFSVPLLCGLGMIRVATDKAERVWKRFSSMRFYGGITDFVGDAVLDKESGYIGLYAFLSLYEATKDRVWLDRAAFCADYMETYQVLRKDGFYAVGTRGNEHYNMASVGNGDLRPDGLGFISASCCAGDVMNVVAVPLLYKLGKYTGDGHYIDYAAMLERNSLCYIDLYDKAGSLGDVLLGSGAGYVPEYFQLAASVDPVGPYTGCAHDATIAWPYYVMLASQQGVYDLIGRYFINGNRVGKMKLNVAPLCSFTLGGARADALSSLDFYECVRFRAGDVLSAALACPSEKVVFAHGDMFADYSYRVAFIDGNGEVACERVSDGDARFVCFDVPPGCVRIDVLFGTEVCLRQIQIFALCDRSVYEKIRRTVSAKTKKDRFLSGSAYSPVPGRSLPWKYLYKRDGKYYPLFYDDVSDSYRCGDDEYLFVKTGNLVHPGTDAAVVRSFDVPSDGTYVVYDEISASPYLVKFGGKVNVRIYANEDLLSEKLYIIQKRRSGRTEIKRKLKRGTTLYFEVSSTEAGNRNCAVSREITIFKVSI